MGDVAGRLIGVGDFSAGETTLERVSPGSEGPVMERISGYRCEDGSLVPEELVSELCAGECLGDGVPEQTPVAFVDGDSTIILARDADHAMRELRDSEWGGAGGMVRVLPDARPARLGRQVIFPSGPPMPELMIYEPGSGSTKLRPLSIKSPSDYQATLKPTVTPSTLTPVALFENDDLNPWLPASAAYTVSTIEKKVVLTLDENSARGAVAFKKCLTDDWPDGKALGFGYILIDLKLGADLQQYDITGLFTNDSNLLPSGYKLTLYSEADCTGQVASYQIPRLDAKARVTRVALKVDVDPVLLVVKSISIDTASFYTPPPAGSAYTLTVWSEAYTDGWTHKGNYIMPEVVYPKSPLAKAMEAVKVDTKIVTPPQTNILLDGGFEESPTVDWTLVGADIKVTDLFSRSGACSLAIYRDADYAYQESINVAGGRQYLFECWDWGEEKWRTPPWPIERWSIVIQPYAGANPEGSPVVIPGNTQRLKWTQTTQLLTMPLAADSVTITIVQDVGLDLAGHGHYVDDVSLYACDATTAGAAYVIQTFSEDLSNRYPANPMIHYVCCYAGKDRLESPADFSLMVSNPSVVSGPDVVADPWRSYTVALAMPAGVVSVIAAAPTAGGTGYGEGDVLELKDPASSAAGALVRVVSAPGGVVSELELVARGAGYTAAAGKVTLAQTGSGTGCTVNVTAITDQRPVDEYGDYLTHVLFYRQIYDGSISSPTDELGVWSTWDYIGSAEIGASVSYLDNGHDQESSVLARNVPVELETTNPVASSAQFVEVSRGRIYATGLDWDAASGAWKRPTTTQISSDGKPWSFPSLVDETTLATDGAEFDQPDGGGAAVGMAVLGEDVLVFLDDNFFHLRGENVITGWRALGRQRRRLGSNRSIAICDQVCVFHDGVDFCGYAGGEITNLSRFKIDSSAIDWGAPHNAVYWRKQYVIYCRYDPSTGAQGARAGGALIRYDTQSGAWRVRQSQALDGIVGIATDGEIIYGLTEGGDVVDVMGGSNDYGADAVVREVWTRYFRVAPRGYDVQINELVFDVACDEAVEVDITYRWLGLLNGEQSVTRTWDPLRSRQSAGVNVQCEFLKVELAYEGTSPPEIHFIGCDSPEGVTR